METEMAYKYVVEWGIFILCQYCAWLVRFGMVQSLPGDSEMILWLI